MCKPSGVMCHPDEVFSSVRHTGLPAIAQAWMPPGLTLISTHEPSFFDQPRARPLQLGRAKVKR